MRFSEHFNLNRGQAYLDFLDIPLDTDLPVFLSPDAIASMNSPWGNELASMLQTFFDTVLRNLKNGNTAKAQKLLSSLSERNEFHLGYSAGESRGHGFGDGSAESVWKALVKSNAAKTGLLKDLEDTALLIPGIGTDMISDAVCNIIRGPLIKYTQDMCAYYGIELTPDIASGPIWNPQKETWEESLIPLPMTPYGKVILVPKLLVRHRISYKYGEFYRHYILPQMQHEHLQAGSPLVEVLKNGSERVTKKALIDKYGKDKLAVVEQARLRPNILQEYKNQKAKTPSKPLTQEELSEVESSDLPDLDALVNELKSIPTGRESAGDYEDVIERILSVIFYPSLCNPKKQDKIHGGRKRIDITYTNEAKNGFFHWLSLHYPCPMIFVECKNYGKDAGNPEIDQLAGRFSPSRGKVGFLICRSIENRDLMDKRCLDTVQDDRGFLLVLDDKDIISLIESTEISGNNYDFDLLRERWSSLIK